MKTILFFLLAAFVGAFALFSLMIWAAVDGDRSKLSDPEPATTVKSQSEPTNINDAYKPAISKSFTPALWGKELLEIEKLAKDGRNLSGDQAFTLALRASAAIGAIDTMSPQPRGKFAKLHCAMAAQAITNYIDDMRKDRLFSADDQMKYYKEYKPKCIKDLQR